MESDIRAPGGNGERINRQDAKHAKKREDREENYRGIVKTRSIIEFINQTIIYYKWELKNFLVKK